MKEPSKQASVAALILLFTLLATCLIGFQVEASPEDAQGINVWFIVKLRDYETDMPVPNMTLRINFQPSSVWETVYLEDVTNETGTIQRLIKTVTGTSNVKALLKNPPRISRLEVLGNYTVIKINNLFMDEDVTFTGWYETGRTIYTNMRIPLTVRNLGSQIYVECNIWVLDGKLVRVSDYNPITEEKETLTLKPALRANIEDFETAKINPVYESYFFFPINYEVTITPTEKSGLTVEIPPLHVRVDENTTLISWTYLATKCYVEEELSSLSEELGWFKALGLPLTQEYKEYEVVGKHFERALNLILLEEYEPALGGIKRSLDRLNGLRSWLTSQKAYSILTTISICLFIYGLSSLLPSFLLEEQAGKRTLLVIRVSIFSLLLVILSLTHFSFKILYAVMAESILGAPVIGVDIPTSLWGCFVLGTLVYFSLTLISARKAAITDLSLQLGIRGMKRRPLRTILSLITITIVVSSAIILVNISIARESRVMEAWDGTNTPAIILQADILSAPLSEYDINWTKNHEWCKDIGYREEVITYQENVARSGVLIYGEGTLDTEIICIDPDFLENNYNFSMYIRGLWSEFQVGEPVAIIPSTFRVPIGDYVTLGVMEVIATDGPPITRTRTFGSFRVVGRFDPASLLRASRLDNRPLFEKTDKLILVPIKSINDYSIGISEASILVEEGFDIINIAKEIAYLLGVVTIVNMEGRAVSIEWRAEWTVRGFIPYIFPLVISGLMIYVTMTSIYEERRREFMAMATLGLDPKNSFQVFIIETLLLGFMGTLFGFLGSYIIVTSFSWITTILKGVWLPLQEEAIPPIYVHWSLPSILVALLTGTFTTFLGGCVPAARAQGLSLLGRVKKRTFLGEFTMEKDKVSLTFPLRVPLKDSDLLYRFVRENLGKFKKSVIDPHSVKGELRMDGTFTVSFTAMGPGRSVFIPCEIKGLREGDTMVSLIEFPYRYRNYHRMKGILRNLEERMIEFPSWREMQRRMKIVREAPKRRKTPEEILIEVKEIIEKIRDDAKRLRFLDSRKSQLSEAIYEEFRQKYLKRIDDETKKLRTLAVGLESYHNELNKEIKKIEVEIERFTIAYNLGEMNEEEYVKKCGPLQARLDVLRSKFKELEEIFEFLKMPSRII